MRGGDVGLDAAGFTMRAEVSSEVSSVGWSRAAAGRLRG